MKRARFDLFALGTRRSPTRLMSEELSYWSDHEERVIGLVMRDTTDDDFGWILLARDKIGRFRCVDLDMSLNDERYATQQLRERIARAVDEQDFLALGDQGDETNYPTDVLRVVEGMSADQLHPNFQILLRSRSREPARAVFKEIGPWLAPSDPHFVQEFQTKHFDQRLWEMYLWAAFRELGFDITQPEAPDFLCKAPGIEFTVEATTVAPSLTGPLANRPDPTTPDEMREFLEHYMPMKFGSSLTSKLNKRNKLGESYWERGLTRDKPFLLAIADFHHDGSMTYTHSALWPYLYGRRVDWEVIDGQLSVRAVQRENHSFGTKVIPTGFFDLPNAENISAVVFSNAGTLAKFDRMGIAAGVIPPKYRFFRTGLRYNPDPNAVIPEAFSEEVGLDSYEEYWSDELQIFHNPNARHPLDPHTFGGVTQHFFENGEQHSITPVGAILASRTTILHLRDEDEEEPTDPTIV